MIRRYKNKYNNIPTIVNGITFDSRKEANRYQELRLLVRAKKITNLDMQVSYILLDSFTDFSGKKQRAITYRADFVYKYKCLTPEGEKIITVVEDVKGVKTNVYKLKKKMFLDRYPMLEFKET